MTELKNTGNAGKFYASWMFNFYLFIIGGMLI